MWWRRRSGNERSYGITQRDVREMWRRLLWVTLRASRASRDKRRIGGRTHKETFLTRSTTLKWLAGEQSRDLSHRNTSSREEQLLRAEAMRDGSWEWGIMVGLANHVLMKGMIKACSLCKVRRHAFLGNAIGQHEPISALDRCWHRLKNTGLLKRDYVTT